MYILMFTLFVCIVSFMQSQPVLDRQEHVLHRNKSGNLMLTLRSCFSNKYLTG